MQYFRKTYDFIGFSFCNVCSPLQDHIRTGSHRQSSPGCIRTAACRRCSFRFRCRTRHRQYTAFPAQQSDRKCQVLRHGCTRELCFRMSRGMFGCVLQNRRQTHRSRCSMLSSSRLVRCGDRGFRLNCHQVPKN